MKTFTKVMLALAGIFAAAGVVCMIIAFIMGFSTSDFIKMFQDGDFSVRIEDGEVQIFGINDSLILEIEDAFEENENLDFEEDGDMEGIVSSTETEEGRTTTYEVEEVCNNMDVEFGAGVLVVYYDDVECIQVKQTNIPNLKVNVKNNTLVISEGADINVDLDDIEDRSLNIFIPRDMKFEEVELEIGASKADIKDIFADDVSITVGAGQADVSKITAKQFDLEVGAGQATAVQLDVEKLNVEAGMGQVNIALNGVQEEYNYTVECGIGNVMVGGASYGGLGAEQSVRHEGARKEINIECGIGEVRIKFKQ